MTATGGQAIRTAELLYKYLEKERTGKTSVHWFYGPTGTGKTYRAYQLCDTADEPPYTAMGSSKWWDGYDGHKIVVIDDMRADFMPFQQLLRLFDEYPMRVECKGGSRQVLANTFYVTCPFPPSELFGTIPNEDVGQLLRRLTSIVRFAPMGVRVDETPVRPPTYFEALAAEEIFDAEDIALMAAGEL